MFENIVLTRMIENMALAIQYNQAWLVTLFVLLTLAGICFALSIFFKD